MANAIHTIVESTGQRRVAVESNATTLGELKVDLGNAGVQYANQDFFEALSRTKLVDDNTLLPRQIPFTDPDTGETAPTDNLIIVLSTTNKKIDSGSARTELYAQVRRIVEEQPNLSDELGNYTQKSNAFLQEFVDTYGTTATPVAQSPRRAARRRPEVATEVEATSINNETANAEEVHRNLATAILILARASEGNGVISEDKLDQIEDLLSGNVAQVAEVPAEPEVSGPQSPYGNSAIDNVIGDFVSAPARSGSSRSYRC